MYLRMEYALILEKASHLCAKMWRVIVDLPFQYGKFNAVCIIAEIVNFANWNEYVLTALIVAIL